jgi:hypothetical protein
MMKILNFDHHSLLQKSNSGMVSEKTRKEREKL